MKVQVPDVFMIISLFICLESWQGGVWECDYLNKASLYQEPSGKSLREGPNFREIAGSVAITQYVYYVM